MKLENKDFPGLYRAASKASQEAQNIYYRTLITYIVLLIAASAVSFYWNSNVYGSIVSASLFLITLGLLIFLKTNQPEKKWYNGRAVAESVKTRTWRWCMRAEPYSDADDITIEKKRFISDLKEILKQNQSLSDLLETEDIPNETISTKMSDIRGQSIPQRLEIYKERRIDDQVKWYAKKANYNKTRSRRWFTVSLVFHAAAIVMLLFKIKNPVAKLPVEVIATATGGVLTWIQAKKHNELNASYSHTAHEIMLIKAEAISIVSEDDFSMYVLNTENAFSREHTQWIARKSD